jgi:hypothetical protein
MEMNIISFIEAKVFRLDPEMVIYIYIYIYIFRLMHSQANFLERLIKVLYKRTGRIPLSYCRSHTSFGPHAMVKMNKFNNACLFILCFFGLRKTWMILLCNDIYLDLIAFPPTSVVA